MPASLWVVGTWAGTIGRGHKLCQQPRTVRRPDLVPLRGVGVTSTDAKVEVDGQSQVMSQCGHTDGGPTAVSHPPTQSEQGRPMPKTDTTQGLSPFARRMREARETGRAHV